MVAFGKTLQGEAAAQSFLALGTTVDELTEGTILMLCFIATAPSQ